MNKLNPPAPIEAAALNGADLEAQNTSTTGHLASKGIVEYELA